MAIFYYPEIKRVKVNSINHLLKVKETNFIKKKYEYEEIFFLYKNTTNDFKKLYRFFFFLLMLTKPGRRIDRQEKRK